MQLANAAPGEEKRFVRYPTCNRRWPISVKCYIAYNDAFFIDSYGGAGIFNKPSDVMTFSRPSSSSDLTRDVSTVSRRQKPSRIGFTLVELLVVIAIIAMLAALLFPVGSRMLHQAQGAACANNLRRTGELVFVYAGENDGYFPWLIGESIQCFNRTNPFGTLAGYDGMSNAVFTNARAKTIWNCPAQATPVSYFDYAGNVHVMGYKLQGAVPLYPVRKLTAVKKPSATILMADNASGETNGMSGTWFSSSTNQWPWPQRIGARHNGKANVLFCDGHVASLYTRDDTNSPRNPADLITDDKLDPLLP